MTVDLLSLADWVVACGVTQVAMESTGVYWKPVSNLLETRFTILVVKAQHIKPVPGRKTDAKDCQWIAQLLQHGLLRAGFVPPRPIRQLRDLTRQRTQLIRQRATMANRLQKVLEDPGRRQPQIGQRGHGPPGCVGPRHDPGPDRWGTGPGAPGRLGPPSAPGQDRPAGPRLDRPSLRPALLPTPRPDGTGRAPGWSSEQLDGRSREATIPFEAELARRMTIPGLSRQAAEVLIAEIGADRTAFPTAGHRGSWAGMAPGNHPSAGQRYSGRTTKGSPGLRSVVVQAAWSASHTKKTRLGTTYHQLARRIGKKRAVVAVGRKILKRVDELKGRRDDQERWAPDQAA
jgi:transposase